MAVFILIGYDGKDPEAPSRRMAVRDAHLVGARTLREQGVLKFATAIVNDDEQLIGSIMVYEVADRAALDALLKEELYVTAGVWQDIQILPGRIPPIFQEAPV